MSWQYPTAPQTGAIEIDFAQLLRDGTNVPGQIRQTALAGIGALSPGEWTLYMLRLCYLEAPDDPRDPVQLMNVSIQAGTDRARGDLLGLAPPASTISIGGEMRTMAAAYRGLAFHISASTMDASITYRAVDRDRDDRLLCWVSPGRPMITRIEGQGVTQQSAPAALAVRQRIPVFARRVSGWLNQDALATVVTPRVIFYSGPTPIASPWILPIILPNRTRRWEWIIPESATHMAFLDDGPGATPCTVVFQYEIES